MKRYLTLSSLALVIGYIKISDKGNYQLTSKQGKNLYVEVYRSGYDNCITSEYLTDSTNFRIYLGAYTEDEQLITKYNGDNIIVEKLTNTSSIPEWNQPKVTERKTYSLTGLKKQHVFE